MTLTLTDNGSGDSDSVSGQITDPGGAAVLFFDYFIDNSRPMIVMEQLVNTETTYTQSRSAVAALTDGGYVTVFEVDPDEGDTPGLVTIRIGNKVLEQSHE